ncbi:DrmB family protein [Brachybacterium tyrofermentans]|uniref:DrmB family protein n=1 Tax=Brachybacterium tyrofermentans TaxID=47848 RepID=UPI003FD20D43
MSSRLRARRSALLTTYGVGSLFPADDSSYLIAGLHMWDKDKLPTISEPRLTRQLRAGELKSPPATPDDRRKPGVPVTLFPRILVCPGCSALGTTAQLGASSTDKQCGLCPDQAALMPSRFISACQKGHLDDFPYYEWVHSTFPNSGWGSAKYPRSTSSNPKDEAHKLRLISRGRSSALSDIVVRCSCGKSRDMADSFSPLATKTLRCSGNRPWLGFAHREKECGADRRTLQRGASNAWFGVTSSAISIPPYSGRISAIVSRERANLVSMEKPDLESAARTGSSEVITFLLKKYPHAPGVAEFASQALQEIYPEEAPALSDEAFRLEEYKAIVEGMPEEPDSQFVSESVKVPAGATSILTEVRRISRLREVRALSGFTRVTSPEQMMESEGEGNISPLRPADDLERWLPATELLGEGLFVGLDHAHLKQWAGTQFAIARGAILNRNAREAARRRGTPAPPKVDMTKLALHTFAHLLIDQLALEAGYPASSLRERLYAGDDMAGVLIYTASADSAGSLGGVAAMADTGRLGPALDEAQHRLSWCSADPVCIESTGAGTDGANLAACHNCMLLPETSCEEFNVLLDRGALFGTLETPGGGLFAFLGRTPRNAPAAEAEAPLIPADQVPPEVFEAGWGEFWEEFPEHRTLIMVLIENGVPLPTFGAEIGSRAYGSDMTWEAALVAVVGPKEMSRDESLEDDGWTVLNAGMNPDEMADTIIREAM